MGVEDQLLKKIFFSVIGPVIATVIAISVTVLIGASMGSPTDIDHHRDTQRYLLETGVIEGNVMSAEESEGIYREIRERERQRNFEESLATDVRSVLIYHAWLLGLLTFAVFLMFRLSMQAAWFACVAGLIFWFWAAPVTAVFYLSGYFAHVGARALRRYFVRT